MENIFTGNKIIENCFKIKELSKNNGFATLISVSKNNSTTIKLGLEVLEGDKIINHKKTISFKDGLKFIEEITNIGILILNSKKEENINLFKQLPLPIKILRNEQGQPLIFSTNDEFEGIKEFHGENTTFVWKSEGIDNSNVAIQFINIDTFIDNLIKILQNNIGDKYYSVKPIGLSIGKIKWKKENEFGILIDYKSNYEFFLHKNFITNINELNEGSFVYFSSSYNLKKEEVVVNKVNLIGEITSEQFYDIVFEQYGLIKANSENLSPQIFNQLERKLVETKRLINLVTDKYLQDEINIGDFKALDKFFTDGLYRVVDSSRFNYFLLLPIETYFYDIIEKDYCYSVLAKFNKKNIESIINAEFQNLGDRKFEVQRKIISKLISISKEAKSFALEKLVELKKSKLILDLLLTKDLNQYEFGVLCKIINELNSKELKLLIENIPARFKVKLILYIINNFDEEYSLENNSTGFIIMEELKNIPKNERNKLVDCLYLKSNEYYRLMLWLYDYTIKFNYDTFKLLCFTLPKLDQSKAFKKIFREIALGNIKLPIEKLNQIVRFDRTMSQNYSLDYSLDIVINAIISIREGKKMENETNISNILVEHFVINEFDNFQISNFFEKCEGRTLLKHDKSTDSYTKEKKNNIPVFRYCEGRKAIDKDIDSNLEFWWCKNQPCFQPCQSLKNIDDWENYTLLDFINILKIEYNKDDYFVFIGVINRINTLLEHLNCRGCNKILKPKGQSKYSFHRVNYFYCDNNNCFHNEDIYLNHCLACGTFLDSRDSKKCPNGLVICPDCNSCCSTKMFQNRVKNLEKVGEKVSDYMRNLVINNLGHAERKMYYCAYCGNQMKAGWEDYDMSLKWLIANKDIDSRIVKSGQRESDNMYWFLVDFPEDKINNLEKIGFNIKYNKSSVLVSEPINKEKTTPKYCINKNCRT